MTCDKWLLVSRLSRVESSTSTLFVLRMASNSQSDFGGTSSTAETAIRTLLKSLSAIAASIDFLEQFNICLIRFQRGDNSEDISRLKLRLARLSLAVSQTPALDPSFDKLRNDLTLYVSAAPFVIDDLYSIPRQLRETSNGWNMFVDRLNLDSDSIVQAIKACSEDVGSYLDKFAVGAISLLRNII